MRCARIRAAAALLFAALATLSVLPSARAADYDLLVLRQDWQPSSCTTSQCTIPAFGVFSVQALVPSSSTSKDPTDCQDGPAFNAAEIPADILDQLNCVLMDNAAAGSNKGLWEAIWNMYGRCTGMTVSDYFNFIVGQYNLQNANTALAEAGIEAGGQLVDRDRVLTALTKAWGKKAWAACDTKTRYLSYVSACFDRYSWELVDCPWDPNAPIDYGQECAGELIIKQGTAPSAACESSFPVTLAGAFPTATPPPPPPPPPPSSDPGGGGGGGGGSPTPTTSSSSSTSIGPIIGAVCGGIAVVVAAAVLFLVVRKRRAARHAAATAWDAQTNSKDEEKVEEQANSDSMLDTFVTMHSGDEGQPGGGGSLDGAAGAPTAPATPSIVVASLGTAQPANHERPAGLPADYRTLDSAPTPVSSGTPTATAFASGGSVASGGAVNSGGTVASGGALNSGGTAGYAIVVNSGGTAGSGGASGAPSATPSGQRLLGGGSEIWAINFAELKLLHVVGEGSFGRVYAAEWHSTSVAVKMLYQAPSTAGSGSLSSGGGGSLSGNLAAAANLLAKLEDEADIMFSLRHPNVVQIMGICTDPPCLVTEFCAKGSLANCLRAARSDASVAAQLTWRRRLTMALDAARGLLYLHSRGIVHRDLKGPNLLADEHWRVKVSDFNLSKHLDKTGSTSLAAMNPRWLANEVMQGERATQASDVFAYAVIMWELLTWELPWATTSPWQIVGLVLGGSRLPLPAPEDVPGPDRLPPAVFQQYTALLQSCWAQNPYDRPPLQSVVEQLRSMLAQLGGEAA